MRESHEIGSQVLVYSNPSDRSRSEFGEHGVHARLATVEEETTPKPQVWNPTHFNPETGYHGRYEEGEPSGPRVYRVVFEDDGSVEYADVHRLMLPAEAAPTIGAAELAARRAADAERQRAADAADAAEAERQRAAAQSIQQF